MPSIETPQQSFSITAVSYGNLTLTADSGSSFANLYSGMVGTVLGENGAPEHTRVVITAIDPSGTITVMSSPSSLSGGALVQTDFTDYESGTIAFEDQVVSVSSLYATSNGSSFTNISPILMETGANYTVDDVIAALQALGLFRQS